MDPDVTRRELATLAAEAMADADAKVTTKYADMERRTRQCERVVQMAEKFQALDEWLSRNGFLPGRWVRQP